MNALKSICAYTLLMLVCLSGTFCQTTVKGTVRDGATGVGLVGAQIVVADTTLGTLSRPDGSFELVLPVSPPLNLLVSALGYESTEVLLERPQSEVNIVLSARAGALQGVVAQAARVEEVVAAVSKLEERVEQAPMTSHSLGLLSLRESPHHDIFSGLEFLPEVQANTGSFTFSSVNTRGFADAQNWRFVTLVDGVDIIAPGLNYSVGALQAGSSLDLNQLELVVGPGSALYGANAFNGVLSLTTKSPFDYEGVSADVKGGITVQEAGGTHPYGEVALRVANKLGNKWAFKLNLNYLTATDWTADDQSHYISNMKVGQREALLSLPRNHPNYDAVSVYGDEVAVPVLLDGATPTLINRTGIAERDIVDYGIQTIKVGAALHHRINKRLEAIYDYKFVQGDAILRHTTTYPFEAIRYHAQKLELRGDHFYVRAYHTWEDANESYAMLATGAFIQEGLSSSAQWSADYGAAFRGEIPGVTGGNHDEARTFADRNIPSADSEAFQALRDRTLSNPDIQTGGSQFIDRSRLLHAETNYDLSEDISWIDLQVGGSIRQYSLNSEGQLFNDGPQGFDGRIPIAEYGAYVQASRGLFKNRLQVRGSLRYDKNQNFQGRMTPRGAAVLSLGKKDRHSLRFTAQTGFRNPASQETYIALDLGEAIILGGTEDNITNYAYTTAGGTTVGGMAIHQNLVTLPSLSAFLATGGTDPSLLKAANLAFLTQEQIQTLEVGYKAELGERIAFSLNAYQNTYTDLVSRTTAYSLEVQRAFAVYTNISEQVRSQGASLELAYRLPRGLRLAANYAWTTFDAEDALAAYPDFLPSFNTPEHRVNVIAGHRDLGKGIGCWLNYRWTDTYLWQSPFGQGDVQAHHQLDASITVNLPQIRSMVKLGATNLLRDEYRSIYGGPNIGSVYYVSFTVDELRWK